MPSLRIMMLAIQVFQPLHCCLIAFVNKNNAQDKDKGKCSPNAGLVIGGGGLKGLRPLRHTLQRAKEKKF